MEQFLSELPLKGNFSFSKVQVRLIQSNEQKLWQSLMKKHHYLGFSNLMGERLQYVATVDGTWVALLAWASAALKIRDRDMWIGWDQQTKMKRLKFVVNNWRFLILPEFHIPNLASKILAINLKRLNQDWFEKYYHPVLMVETFVDSSRFKATSYKASGWLEVGETSGYRRHYEKYIYHGQKKRILLKPLVTGAKQILQSPMIHPIFINNTNQFKRSPLMNNFALPLEGPDGLLNLVRSLPDGRSVHGLRHRKEGLMMVSILATLAGAITYKGILKWAQALSEEYREKILLWKMPSVSTVRRFLLKLDTDKIDQIITEWLLRHDSLKGKIIAVDGKVVRGSYKDSKKKKGIQLLSAVIHQEGTVIAQKQIDSKTNEIPELRNLLNDINIEGSVITADALHTQTKTAGFIIKKADYIFTVKENQKSLLEDIKNALENPYFTPYHQHAETIEKGHGRIDMRNITVLRGCPMKNTFPGSSQIFKVERIRQNLAGDTISKETAYCITSLGHEMADPERLLDMIRGHWTIENKLHHVRDVTFKEDSSRIRTGNGAHAMAILKNISINILRTAGVKNIRSAICDCAWDSKKIFQLFCDRVR